MADCLKIGGLLEGCLRTRLSDAPISHGPQVLVLSSNSATLWVRGASSGTVKVEYWLEGEREAGVLTAYAPLAEQADFTGRAHLSNLVAGRRYDFCVSTAAEGCSRFGSFRTPGGGSNACSFVFGSCVGGQGYGRRAGSGAQSGFPAFEAMGALSPDLFVCNGDFIYADNAIEPVASTPWNQGDEHVIGEGMEVASSLDGFRARYRYHLADAKLATFLSRTPILATWDDHEIVDDWGAERMIANGQSELLEAGMRAWFEYSPHVSACAAEPRRVYRAAQWAEHAHFFVLDCRSYRAAHAPSEGGGTPQMRTILGEAQLEWLLEGLAASRATWKFVCTSVPLSFPTGWPRPEETGYDGWSDGSSATTSGPEVELMRILKHIRDRRISNVVWISGDVHFPFCISYDPFDEGAPLCYEIGATPIHALCLPKPPPGRQDTSLKPTVLYAGDVPFGGTLQNFGRCAVDEAGVATFSIHDAAGGKLYELVLPPTVNAAGTPLKG